MLRPLLLSLSLIFFSAMTISASAQSFKCKYAKYEDEKLICSDPELGELDERMVAVFNEINRQAPAFLKRMLRAEQDGWLRSRHACKWNTRCVRGHYLARTRQLNALFRPRASERYDEDNYERKRTDTRRRYERDDDEEYLPRRLR